MADGLNHDLIREFGVIFVESKLFLKLLKSDDCGVKALTLYAFSTENWSRPLKEVKTLFSLLKKFLKKEKERIIRNKIKFQIIGDRASLPSSTYELVKDLEERTQNHQGLKLTFAFSYGSRTEIIDAVNSYIKERQVRLFQKKN